MPAWIAFGVKSSSSVTSCPWGAPESPVPQPARTAARSTAAVTRRRARIGPQDMDLGAAFGRRRGASLESACACAVASRSAATSRCRSAGRAAATASTARSRPIRPTSTPPTRCSRCSTARSPATGSRSCWCSPASGPRSTRVSPSGWPSYGHADFTSYVVWVCERALERGPAAPHEPRRARRRRPRPPARGDGLPGPDAGVGLGAADGDRARRLADQASGAAAGHDRGGRRAADPVHQRDPRRDRRERGGADGLARRPRRRPRAVTAISRR